MDPTQASGTIPPQVLTTTALDGGKTALVDDTSALVDDTSVLVGNLTTPIPTLRVSVLPTTPTIAFPTRR